ncbi:hypothetical protein BDV34DRAFT_98159 [Aspergillus parasiticus]|uniref:Ig-like domain-containing protein n=1 Tax=Aspergillus parasiticus TaxID=5067 RepID=A0A5N6DKC8_ASPPA|nr:hypothetical protein BDV34DRAFT_98159 [Aspergillus parasiticus]
MKCSSFTLSALLLTVLPTVSLAAPKEPSLDDFQNKAKVVQCKIRNFQPPQSPGTPKPPLKSKDVSFYRHPCTCETAAGTYEAKNRATISLSCQVDGSICNIDWIKTTEGNFIKKNSLPKKCQDANFDRCKL